MVRFQIHIQVVIDKIGVFLPGLLVKAYDKDLLFDDLLGNVITNSKGRCDIICEQGDFDGFFDKRTDIYFKVYSPDRERLLFDTSDTVSWNAGRETAFVIRIPIQKLYGAHEKPSVQLFSHSGISGEQSSPSIGSSLMISAKGLAPATAHEIELSDEHGVLFVSRMMTTQYGELPQSVLWPQFGLDDPHADIIYTVDEAEKRWRNKKLSVRIAHGESLLASESVTIGAFDSPLMLNVDKEGKMLNGFEQGKADIIVAGYNIFHKGDIRVYLVAHQADWNPGDPFTPVTLKNGNAAWVDVHPDEQGRFKIALAKAEDIVKADIYDFIVRKLRYGYRDDERLILRKSDIVPKLRTDLSNYRFPPGPPHVVFPVKMMPLSGSVFNTPPYFKFSNAFIEGDDVWVAIHPFDLPVADRGKMAAIFIVPSKEPSLWDINTELFHLPILGGNAAVIKFKTQVHPLNYDKILVWPAASIAGSYDIIIDFGNNSTDANTFLPDEFYTNEDPSIVSDIIDGYVKPGFRIVEDPGVFTSYEGIGKFEYTRSNALLVQTDLGLNMPVPLKARVNFPSDGPGVSDYYRNVPSPMQYYISNRKNFYPMAIIVHGRDQSYNAYDYLLEHWARNGFIAVSIHLENEQTITDRAQVLFEHVRLLKMRFGAYAENNIGIMGHSRGGEAVAVVPRLNLLRTPGQRYKFNAVISLAPTNTLNETILVLL